MQGSGYTSALGRTVNPAQVIFPLFTCFPPIALSPPAFRRRKIAPVVQGSGYTSALGRTVNPAQDIFPSFTCFPPIALTRPHSAAVKLCASDGYYGSLNVLLCPVLRSLFSTNCNKSFILALSSIAPTSFVAKNTKPPSRDSILCKFSKENLRGRQLLSIFQHFFFRRPQFLCCLQRLCLSQHFLPYSI